MKIARVAAHESGIPILLIHHARERSGDTVDAARDQPLGPAA